MPLFDSIRDSLFTEDPKDAGKSASAEPVRPLGPSMAPVYTTHWVAPSNTGAGDTPMVAMLWKKAKEAANWVRVETFTESMRNLAEFIPAEPMRVRAALKQIADQNGTTVRSACSEALRALEREQGVFSKIVAEQRTVALGQKSAQLDQLSVQIKTLTDQRATLASEIESAERDLSAKEAAFKASATSVADEITAIIKLIERSNA